MQIVSGPVAVLSDLHGEFCDPHAFGAALEVIKYLQPGTIVLNGDIADCYQVSRFTQDPSRRLGFQDALCITKGLLRRLRSTAPDADFLFNYGNHEHRLKRYLWEHPELASLSSLDLHSLLDFEDIGIQEVARDERLWFGRFVITHGEMVRSRGGYTAQGMIDRYGCSGVSGHTHRLSCVSYSQLRETQTWVEGGCLCSLNAEYLTAPPDWQQGFCILQQDGGEVWPELVRISHGRAFYDGRIFKGE